MTLSFVLNEEVLYMKKILSVLLAVVLMAALSVTAFAAVSPGATVVPPTDDGNQSPQSPQTGASVVLLVTAAAASLASAGLAVKKLSEKD